MGIPRKIRARTPRSERAVKWLSPPASPFLTYPELKHYGVPSSRKHLLDLMKRDQFPQQRQLSANRVAWLKSEILAYVANRPIGRVLRPKPEPAAIRTETEVPPKRGRGRPKGSRNKHQRKAP